MLTNFLKNWIADIVGTVAKGLGLTKDNVKMQADDKVFEATITFNNGTEYVYYISPGEDENGQVVFIDRIDGKGATKECRTKSQIIDFLTNDINTGLVAEATEILKQQGYRVVLNESEHYCIQCGREIHGRPAETLDSLEFCSQHCYFDYLEDVNNPDEPDYEDHMD